MPSKDPKQRFADIVGNIDAVQGYTHGMTEAAFMADQKTIDASERCLTRISEAAVKLGMLAEELAPNQPRDDIRGLGNHLRHDYPNVIRETIWKTIRNDLPSLKRDSEAAMLEIDRRHAHNRDRPRGRGR